MLLQDSLIPSAHQRNPETSTHRDTTDRLIQNIRSICDSVFPDTGEKTGKNQHFQLPKGYTSLLDKLPVITDPNTWSDTVIRALFDTMAMPPDGYGFRYGSPEQNILMALRVEVSQPSKAKSFKVLHTQLLVLSQELSGLKVHSYQRERIMKMISEITVLCDRVE